MPRGRTLAGLKVRPRDNGAVTGIHVIHFIFSFLAVTIQVLGSPRRPTRRGRQGQTMNSFCQDFLIYNSGSRGPCKKVSWSGDCFRGPETFCTRKNVFMRYFYLLLTTNYYLRACYNNGTYVQKEIQTKQKFLFEK